MDKKGEQQNPVINVIEYIEQQHRIIDNQLIETKRNEATIKLLLRETQRLSTIKLKLIRNIKDT